MTDCELTNLRAENKLLAEELEKHREAIRRLADQDATLSVQGGNVIVTMDATLTAAEREAVEWFAQWWSGLPSLVATFTPTPQPPRCAACWSGWEVSDE